MAAHLEPLIGIGYKLTAERAQEEKAEENKTNDNADIKKVIDEVGGINEKQTETVD